MLRRFARIYSAYLPCLIIIFCIDTLLWHLNIYPSEYAHAFSVPLALANVFMLNAAPVFYKVHLSFLFGFEQFGTARPLWTLSLEWWTYMAFGLWAFHWTKVTKRPRLIPLFLLISWVPLVNIFGKYGGDLVLVWLIGAVYYHYLRRSDGGMPRMLYHLILGVLVVGYILDIWLLWHDARKSPEAAAYIFDFYNLRLMLIIAAAFCFTIGATSEYPDIIPNRLYYPRVAEYLARYSFTLYLLQHSLLYLLRPLPFAPVALLVLGIAVSNVVSLIVASFTECHYREIYAFLKSHLQKRSWPRWGNGAL